MKTPKSCIFCGAKGGITKEHFWPAWLNHHVQKRHDDRNISVVLEGQTKQPFKVAKEAERQGNVITKGFRVVCTSCNNGWMSRQESRVKPTLLKFMGDGERMITEAEVHHLAQWVTTKVIVGEHAEPKTALTPGADRKLLFIESKIPDYFRIYVGLHSVTSETGYFRHSATLSLTTSGPEPPLSNDIHRNIQTVTFLFGRLIVFVISARISDFDPSHYFRVRHLAQLWPPTTSDIHFDELRVLSDIDLQQLYHVLNQLINSPNVKDGGPLPGAGSNVT